MTVVRILLLTQGLYTLVTAVWPLVHIRSFEAVTGPKSDRWLVKTVGVLLIPVAVCWLYNCWLNAWSVETAVLGIGTAAGLMTIDVYYNIKKRIARIYLADAVLQLLFLV